MMKVPLVSVVVTTKNEEKNIARCLASIKAQTHPNLEIIVVDNDSSDRTKEISRQFTDSVHNKGPERSAQRNYGMIEIARGEYVTFIDADMVLSPHLVERCVQSMEQNDFLALHIPEVIMGDSFWCQVRRFERGFYDGSVVDGSRFFKKKLFQEIGGFDESIYAAEDWDIDKRIKKMGRIGLLERTADEGAVIFHNESDFRLGNYLKKKTYYSHSFGRYQDKWGADDPDVKKQFSPYFRFIGVFVEDGKWKKLLSHPLLAGGMYVLRGLVGFVYLKHCALG